MIMKKVGEFLENTRPTLESIMFSVQWEQNQPMPSIVVNVKDVGVELITRNTKLPGVHFELKHLFYLSSISFWALLSEKTRKDRKSCVGVYRGVIWAQSSGKGGSTSSNMLI